MADDLGAMPANTTGALRLHYDVLLVVFDYLDPWHAAFSSQSNRENRRALLQIARSCRTLSDLALDVLWKKLDNIGNLFLVLSSLTKVSSECMDCNELQIYDRDEGDLQTRFPPEWSMCRDILPHEWTRFQQYARRIHTVSHLRPNMLHRSALLSLFHHNHRQPLLPNVQTAKFDKWHPMDPYPLFVVGLSLRVLHIEVERHIFDLAQQHTRPNHALNILLDNNSADELCSSKAEVPLLGFRSDELPGSRYNQLSGVVLLSWESIVDPGVLHGLSTLPRLVDLSLSLNVSDEDVQTVHRFSSLQRLSLRGRISRLAEFIEAEVISAPRLRSLDITMMFSRDRSPEQCCRCVSAACSKYGASIREFRLMTFLFGKVIDTELPEQPVTNAIRPLLDLHDLEVIHIIPPPRWSLTLSDSGIHDIAASWPKLTEFVTDLYFSNVFATPAGLVEFATHCPSLRKLHLPFLAIPLLQLDPEAYPVLSHRLKELQISNIISGLLSDDCDYSQFAQFLDRIFPRLDIELCAFHGWLGTPNLQFISALKTTKNHREKKDNIF